MESSPKRQVSVNTLEQGISSKVGSIVTGNIELDDNDNVVFRNSYKPTAASATAQSSNFRAFCIFISCISLVSAVVSLFPQHWECKFWGAILTLLASIGAIFVAWNTA